MRERTAEVCALAASAWRRCVAASARAGASPCAACASSARVAYRLLIEFRKRVRPYLSIGVGVRLCVSVWVSRYSQTTAPRILSPSRVCMASQPYSTASSMKRSICAHIAGVTWLGFGFGFGLG